MNLLFTCAGRRRYLLKYFKENLAESFLADKSVIFKDVNNLIGCFNSELLLDPLDTHDLELLVSIFWTVYESAIRN